MSQSINLIPKEEKQAQQRVKIVKASSVLMIFLFLVVAGVAGYFYYTKDQIQQEIAQEKAAVEGLRSDIRAMETTEVVARNIDKKYKALQKLLAETPHYSVLSEEFEKRIPEAITVTDFSINADSSISVTGIGGNYLSISEFINNLHNPTSEVATEGFEKLFYNVSLNTVTLEKRDSSIKFVAVLNYNKELLHQ